MAVLLSVFIIFTCFIVKQSEAGIDPRNNACPNVIFYHFAAVNPQCYYNPDVLSSVPQMSKRHGYEIESYTTTTKDGYILNLFRIVSKTANATKGPVFIQHGIAINSGSWVDTGSRSLAFYLVNKGYDVWLGNPRGSIYSIEHTSLNQYISLYWKFNIDTLVKYDMKDQINFVYNKTGKPMVYLGHSMGTTMSFMYASEYSDEAGKLLEGIVALAPVAYLDGVLALDILAPIAIPLLDLLSTLQIKGVFYPDHTVHEIFVGACKLLPEICHLLFSTVPGITKQFPPEDIYLFASYWPSGTSIYQMKQFLQINRSKKFQKYDYGAVGNKKNYGTTDPPVYNLTKINVPICLLYGKNDVLYTEKNVLRLFDEIGSSDKCIHSIPFNGNGTNDFSHMDFIYSKNIVEQLYIGLVDIIETLKQ